MGGTNPLHNAKTYTDGTKKGEKEKGKKKEREGKKKKEKITSPLLLKQYTSKPKATLGQVKKQKQVE